MTEAQTAPAQAPTAVERVLAKLLRPFAKVEPPEALTAGIMTLTVFLLLMAYYFLKTAREPLILLHGGAEVKSYASAGQSMLLLFVVPAYGAIARRVSRMQLIAGIYLFFAVNLLVFAALTNTAIALGVPFYLWVGVFNVTAIAMFWSFANDIYSPEQGKRLFAVLGIGSSIGAVVGALIAKRLSSLGPQAMMLGAAGVLVLCVGLFAFVDSRERRAHAARSAKTQDDSPVLQGPLLSFLLHDKYLLLIAALTFLLNCVNSTGEYLLDRTLLSVVQSQGLGGSEASTFVASFKAEYFGWVNLAGVLLQLFAVSRILALIGVRRALFILPIVALASYGIMLVAPVLALIRVGKIAENSLDYSVQNTSRQALFLVGTRAEKYVGKTAVDTFVVRSGDVFSAGVVWTGAQLALGPKAFAAVNIVFILVWLGVLVALGAEHARRSAALENGNGKPMLKPT